METFSRGTGRNSPPIVGRTVREVTFERASSTSLVDSVVERSESRQPNSLIEAMEKYTFNRRHDQE